MVRSRGSMREFLAKKEYRKTFSFGRCLKNEPNRAFPAQTPALEARGAEEEPASLRRNAAPARTEADSLTGPRNLIRGAIELARKLSRQTRVKIEGMRQEKQLRKEDLLAQKRAEEYRKTREQEQQAGNQAPWDPGQTAWNPPASAPGSVPSSAGSAYGYAAPAGAPGSYPSSAGSVYGSVAPAGGSAGGSAGGQLSAFPQSGVSLQDLQPRRPQGGPLDPTSP